MYNKVTLKYVIETEVLLVCLAIIVNNLKILKIKLTSHTNTGRHPASRGLFFCRS